jgi:hypothetical protein
MKKTQFGKPEFSVAMSLETGCIVMVKMINDKQSVCGSLTRDDSLKFAQGILDWRAETVLDAQVVPVEPEKPKLTLVN